MANKCLQADLRRLRWALSEYMNENQKDLLMVFILFLAISLALFALGFKLPAIIISGFGSLACLERVFRWYKQANSINEKIAASFCGFLSWAPFLIYSAINGKLFT